MTRTGAIEKKRLRELYRYRILDTPPEAEFDGLCDLARSLLGADSGQGLQTVHFLNYKKRIEARLNQALAEL